MIYKVKRNYYKNILEDKIPEAVYLLGGDLLNHHVKKRTLDGLITLLYKGRSPNLIGGTEARILAVLELAEYFPGARIITLSHKVDRENNNYVSLALKARLELHRKGLSLSRISLLEKSTSTFTELIELIKYSSFNKWKTNIVVTNNYHLERAKLMYYLLTNKARQDVLYKICLNELKSSDTGLFENCWRELVKCAEDNFSRGMETIFIPAEEILPERYVFYEKVIDKVVTLESFLNMEAIEEEGVRMIVKGTYDFNHNHNFENYLHFNIHQLPV